MEPQPARQKSFEQLLHCDSEIRCQEEMQVEVTYEGDHRCDGQRRLKTAKGDIIFHAVSPLVSSPAHSPPIPSFDAEDGDRADETAGSVQTEKQIMKNTVILGLGFLFVFSAFMAMQSFQSSLFLETGLGLHSLSVLYGLAVFSCLYGPVVVHKLTPNRTIISAFFLVGLFIASFLYPRPYTLVPSAALLGLAFGPLFCAKATLLMKLVSRMAYLTPIIRDKVQQRYLRLFYLFFNSSRIWGHVVAALVLVYAGDVAIFTNRPNYILSRTEVVDNSSAIIPASMYRTRSSPTLCAEFQCRFDTSPVDASLPREDYPTFIIVIPWNVTFVLSCVLLGLVATGIVIVAVFLDRFDVYLYQDPMERSLFTLTLRQVRLVLVDPHMRLTLPMLLFIGLEQGFIFTDFTRSYVSCALGLEAVGFTMMSMGLLNTLGPVAVHQFSKHIKRPTIMAAGLICQAGLLLVLRLWTPVKDDVAVFYVIASGWGLCNAIWETLTMSYVAMIYADEWQAPFSVYHLMQMIGMATACIYSRYLCTEIKIYILALSLLIAIVPYTLVEFRLHHRNCVQQRTAVL